MTDTNTTDAANARAGGGALVAGALGFILTMALHPSGHDFVAREDVAHAALVGRLAHGLAIASQVLLFAGSLALLRRLASRRRLELAGVVALGCATVAGILAAVLNGFVATGLLEELAEAGGAERDGLHLLLESTFRLNQALAGLLVVASWVAVLLWSGRILASGALARGLGLYGLFAGVLALAAFLSGHVRLDVHGFGLLVLAQSVWFVAAGVGLWRRSPRAEMPSLG